MIARKILSVICLAFVLAEARWHQKRETSTICDTSYNTQSKILCYCIKDSREPELVRSADCYLTAEGVKANDHTWDSFEQLKSTTKLTLSNSRGVALPYIPTHALKHVENLIMLDIKHGNIESLHPYAFANLSSLEQISITDSQLKILRAHSFAHLKDLTEIKLDKNNVVEINRDVFMDLPSLERLFLTGNQITTLHDKAFVHLGNLKELEINMNKVFSLNSETFSGLRKLQKLDLSSNNLEVIGDNTFVPLKNLQILNLEGNKIQMVDEKAFNGLGKLQHLSLAHNKLSNIENQNTFTGLEALQSLSLKANEMSELKTAVMAPLLENFYKAEGHLDVEDNNFPCDCRLDWFMTLLNKTRSKSIKLAVENLKCTPDTKLREVWNSLEESERNSGQMFEAEAEENPSAAAEYEYYDDSQLNGKLFYTDIRDMINCNNGHGDTKVATEPLKVPTIKTTKASSPISHIPTNPTATPKTTTPISTTKVITHKIVSKLNQPDTRFTNHGLLDLSVDETTPNVVKEKTVELKRSDSSYTTSRLATVSANPIEKTNVYDNMASDEAQPDKLKAQRSVQEDYSSNGNKNVVSVALITILCMRLFN